MNGKSIKAIDKKWNKRKRSKEDIVNMIKIKNLDFKSPDFF
jgi:hypothetical protein